MPEFCWVWRWVADWLCKARRLPVPGGYQCEECLRLFSAK